MTATPEEIERLAHEIYIERAKREQAGHRQGIVPWSELGETFKVSIRRMAEAQLENSK